MMENMAQSSGKKRSKKKNVKKAKGVATAENTESISQSPNKALQSTDELLQKIHMISDGSVTVNVVRNLSQSSPLKSFIYLSTEDSAPNSTASLKMKKEKEEVIIIGTNSVVNCDKTSEISNDRIQVTASAEISSSQNVPNSKKKKKKQKKKILQMNEQTNSVSTSASSLDSSKTSSTLLNTVSRIGDGSVTVTCISSENSASNTCSFHTTGNKVISCNSSDLHCQNQASSKTKKKRKKKTQKRTEVQQSETPDVNCTSSPLLNCAQCNVKDLTIHSKTCYEKSLCAQGIPCLEVSCPHLDSHSSGNCPVSKLHTCDKYPHAINQSQSPGLNMTNRVVKTVSQNISKGMESLDKKSSVSITLLNSETKVDDRESNLPVVNRQSRTDLEHPTERVGKEISTTFSPSETGSENVFNIKPVLKYFSNQNSKTTCNVSVRPHDSAKSPSGIIGSALKSGYDVKHGISSLKVLPKKQDTQVETVSKTKEQLKAERRSLFEARRAELLDSKKKEDKENTVQKSKGQLRAERRALQESQRAVKMLGKSPVVQSGNIGNNMQTAHVIKGTEKLQSNCLGEHKDLGKRGMKSSEFIEKIIRKVSESTERRKEFQLFSHLKQNPDSLNHLKQFGISNTIIHPSVLKTGLQIAQGIITGSNARCISMMVSFRQMVKDYSNPHNHQRLSQDMTSMLEYHREFLNKCRPLSVSMLNSMNYLKGQIMSIDETKDISQVKKELVEAIERFVHEEIILAKRQISELAQNKILQNDVILVYGCSSLVKEVLKEAYHSEKNFRVVVADSRPKLEGQEILKYLTKLGIPCTYLLINAVPYIMKEVTKVLLGAHSLQANGYVMSRIGSSQIALVAHFLNVPVLVCCETYKFSEKVSTDPFVHNELGSTSEFVSNLPIDHRLKDFKNEALLNVLNLAYDLTPPQLVAMVITEKGMLPCTSVPVVLRVRHSCV